MRVFAILGLFCLSVQSASALTCEDIRGYVQTYGVQAVLAYAKANGATAQQIAQGRACLRSGGRHAFRRNSSASAN